MRPEWLRPGGAAAMRSAALGSAPPCGTSGRPRHCAVVFAAQILDSSNDVHNLNIVDRALLIGGKALLRRCSDAQDSIALSARSRTVAARPSHGCVAEPASGARAEPPERVRACVCLYFGRMCSRELPVVCQCELLCVCVVSSARVNVHDFAPIPYGPALHRCAAWLSGLENILQRQASPGWTLTSSSKMLCTATSTRAQSFWRCSGPKQTKNKRINKQPTEQAIHQRKARTHVPASSRTHRRMRPWRRTLSRTRAPTHRRANANVRKPCVIPATRRRPKRSARQEWGRQG
jgi:hypothetical protein